MVPSPPRPPLLALGAGGLAAGLLAIVPLAAGAAPRVPSVTSVRYAVSIDATQTTTWRLVPRASARDCSPLVESTGSGRQVLRVRTHKPVLVQAHRVGGEVALLWPLAEEGDALGTVTRSADVTSRTIGGSCGQNPSAPVDRGPSDCGTKRQARSFVVTYERGRLGVASTPALLGPLTPDRFARCELHAHADVDEEDLTRTTVRIPARELVTRRFGKHVVLGRRTWKLRGSGVTGTTTVRWTMTLVRRGR
ncbi:hypothetical protein SK069_04180 [Patulibacter brassicae]|uniref:Uncharacterized protein n=1 Tax=Patulibacter brassicae TaxID=1705717 RepID=A0ABU4VIP3_9ACTN|nr:hypothetical protein [Patulibacter brassicae]MDX8150783.1 hypothetical protein [Patulibacter brassicae]